MIREVMGFLHSSRILTIITGRVPNTKEIYYSEEFKGHGTISGQIINIDERIAYLDKKYPGLEWEYESWKD